MKTRILTTARVRNAGFTMVEIAIALGVIGFALVAIIGILPTGMNAQRDNRQDTIINNDSTYFMEAIRGGVAGLDKLTNYVDFIRVTTNTYKAGLWTPDAAASIYTNDPSLPDNSPFKLNTGEKIMKVLSTVQIPDTNRYIEVSAYVRALSGSALEQDGANQLVAFKYLLRPEIRLFNTIAIDSTNYAAYTGQDYAIRSNRWQEVRYLTNNLYDVRLRFNWPVLPNWTYARGGAQNFRGVVSATSRNGLFTPQNYDLHP